VAGTSRVAGILDPAGGINRMYNPTSVGLTPAGGDATSLWLPLVSAITPTSVNDLYWAPVASGVGSNSSTPSVAINPNTKYGQITLNLTAGTSDTVRASSVMTFKLSQGAFVIIATGTF
jgi:hypothetical protein